MTRFLRITLCLALLLAAVTAPAALRNRYSFSADASDTAGTAHGTMLGGATVSGGSLVLNGSGAYLDLPNNLVTGYTAITIEVWLINNGSGNWARLFDFGNSSAGEGNAGTGTQYMFLTPGPGPGVLRGAYTTSGSGAGEQIVQSTTALPTGVMKHVVWATDGATQLGRLYVDGVLVGSNTAVTLTPASIGPMNNVWIGRAQFSADAFLNASITEFRIYDTALTPEEISLNLGLGPDTAALAGPVGITVQPQSQAVTELLPVTFSVASSGNRPIAAQWFRDGAAIPGATNDSYSIPSTTLGDDNAVFRVALTNSLTNTTFFTLSSNATLSVAPDLMPPLLQSAFSLYPTQVLVLFSEGVLPAQATNPANYVITNLAGPLAVSAAGIGGNAASVLLTTAPQTLGSAYTLVVNRLRDFAAAGNVIATNSQAVFVATDFVTTNIGLPSLAGVMSPVPGGYDLATSGRGIGGTNDHFTLGYRILNGNFDVEVRLGSLTLADAWTRAGLMARDGTSSNAAYAGSFATPGPAGCFFSTRATAGAVATMAGSFPVNYPDTWLRLRRVGNTFDGYASLDGQSWEFLGASVLPLPATLQVGLALSSGRTNATATAQFREFAPGSGVLGTNTALPFEPAGPSSRRSALIFSEFMYNPPSSWAGTNNLEYVEVWNSGFVTEDLTGFSLKGDISYHFPAGTLIRPGEYLVVAKSPAAAQSFYGVPFLGPYTNTLGNNGGTLRLNNELGSRILDLAYDNKAPWPVAADGTGHSLVLRRASYGENDPRAWLPSDVIGGSPGRGDNWGAEPARQIVINEFLANTDGGLEDFVELYNAGGSAVDVGGFWLSDEAATNKYRIADNTLIPARGFLAFTQTQLGFGLSSDGEHLFLLNSNRTRVIDAVQFDAQARNVSRGRYPDGAPGFVELNTRTAGATNSLPLYRPLVINEIMYNPISGLDDDAFVEIYNRGISAVPLANWQLDDGVQFTFPSNAMIAANSHVVVAKNLTNLLAKYPQLNATNAFGNYSGSLKNSGERLKLQMPEISLTTNGAVITTNLLRITINEVTWRDGGRWGQWSDGGGSSLELIDAWADNRYAASWADSDESLKASWTIIDVTNVLENGQTAAMVNQGGYQGMPNRFEFFLQDDGEALFDDLEFRNNNGANLVANGDFAGGTNGYTFLGTHRLASAGGGAGFGGGSGLWLKASGRGDAGANKISTAIASTVVTNSPNTGTIRAKVRWLKGSPYVMLRTRGHWMEVSQRLNLPANPGTPGLFNSRLTNNAGPAIFEVAHSPVLPAANQPVVISARLVDVDRIDFAQLRYRLDPATNYTISAMNDLGLDGDASAGDGIYSATIPGQSAGTLATFYIYARDGYLPILGFSRFPADAPARECLVRWGESAVAGNIATYRLWVTASNLTAWANRERNANDPLDATFVYGNSRVFYNVKTLYSGSPFHAPSYNGPLGSFSCDYEVNFPADDTLLGSKTFVLAAYDTANTTSLFFADTAGQVDITGNWIARKLGQPFNYRRHMHMVVNGQRRGTIYDDNQQPNGEWLEQHFPDDADGDLRKIEDWFEFADDAQTQGVTTSTIERFNRAGGGLDAKRYRWTWRPRATDDPNNWFALTNMMLAWNDTANPNFINRLNAWVDLPNFLRPIITHHLCGDWDSYGYERGKNMYAYKPAGAGWRLLMWDIELALGNRQSRAATHPIYVIHDPQLGSVVTNNPVIHREYLCGYLDAINGPLLPGAADGLLDERYATFVQNNVPMESPQYIKTFISQRRAYLLGVIPNAAFAVSGPTSVTVNSASNLFTFTGTAPVNAKQILINGRAYPITWTGVTTWTLRVPLATGTNALQFAALDRSGNTLSNATVTVDYTGAVAAPEGSVVLSEIMYRPPVAGSDYLELFNNSTNLTFDLSGWRINGADFTFPAGSIIAPRTPVLVAKDQNTFARTFTGTVPVLAEFGGQLDNAGETLTLLRPGLQPGQELVVNRVRYEPRQPWAPEANGGGAALQVIDTAQDNSRAGNWASSGEWRYVTVNGVANSSRLYVYLTGVGDLFIDDMMLVAGNVPEAGVNRLANGGFESPLAGSWTVPSANQQSHMSVTNVRTGGGSLHLVSTNPLIVLSAILIQDISPALTTGQPYTLSFWFKPVLGMPNLITRMSSGTLNNSPGVSTAPLTATPGAVNSTVATLPPFPPLWLNEVLPNNSGGRLDNQGEAEPWLEILNAGPGVVSLEGLYLSTNYANPLAWAFPAGASIQPGEFKVVVLDGEPGESTLAELHSSFRLGGGTGSVLLSRVVGNSPQVVDYLNFDGLALNTSHGDFPDGQPFYRQEFFYTTPGGTNNGASAPIGLFINEWMASNTGFIRDPADNDTDDWFEIYNPNGFAVDLGAHYLTDNLTNKFQYQVPNNGRYFIPAGGFLLVWADNETGQNSATRPDLHVNFSLAAAGEAIGLHAPDGRLIDSVTFGPQTANVSQGRRPDGGTTIAFFTAPTPRGFNYQPPTSPVIVAPSVLGANVTITFSSVPGVTYRVQFKDDLGAAMWNNLPGDVTATGSASSKSDTNNGTQRFYQVIALP